jgi:hypothetical protein
MGWDADAVITLKFVDLGLVGERRFNDKHDYR